MSSVAPCRATGQWEFAVDRGGTFTDIVGIDPEGGLHTLKLLSVSDRYADAGIAGIRQLLDIPENRPLPAERIRSIRIGTTVATNALLEHKGAEVALCATAGLEDLHAIGNGTRNRLFSLSVEKPPPLCRLVIGIDEEIAADGSVIRTLDPQQAAEALCRIRGEGIEHLAIALKNSWKNPEHERRLARIAREEAGFVHVTASHETMPLIGLYKRTGTVLLESSLAPVLFGYAGTIAGLAGNAPIEFMQSSGGLCAPAALKAKDTILSGPAGGVAGVAEIARTLNLGEAIGFDMGGTSTDVSRCDGRSRYLSEAGAAGLLFHADMLDVETVAAGGGSILSFDGERLRVGPGSAGASPGPACYGLGGPLAITDANLLLGRIVPEFMPRTFGRSRNMPPDTRAAATAFEALAEEVNLRSGTASAKEELAAGFLRVANETMCRAMKNISVARGYDIRTHALVCFGGAAAQHACDIAGMLGITTAVVPAHAGVLSAWGIASADRLERRTAAVMLPLSPGLPGEVLLPQAESIVGDMPDAAPEKEGETQTILTVYLDLRSMGTDAWISVEAAVSRNGEHLRFESAATLTERFHAEHLARYGFRADDIAIEVVNMRVELRRISSRPPDQARPACRRKLNSRNAAMHREVWTLSGFETIPVYDRSSMEPGDTIDGPAMVSGEQLTLFVQRGFDASIESHGHILLRNLGSGSEQANAAVRYRHEKTADPMLLEVFNNLFMNVAEQMGQTLATTAHSVNMKERHDFSCALFDRNGRLVSNAPHIPVHLGAMEATVRHLVASIPEGMRDGEMYLANNPHRGGSHLPDMTVVAPLFVGGETPAFYLANRGHHADIGGTTPGSMPPSSRSIGEEGVIIDAFPIVRNDLFMKAELTALLSSGTWPARNILERHSDLLAQVAANRKGMVELREIVGSCGMETVERYMDFIRLNARQAMNRVLNKLAGKDGFKEFRFADRMDNGTPIAVSIRIDAPEGIEPSAVIDFAGTGPADPGNGNAPEAVVRAAVLYVLRCLVDEDIPLNSGCLERISIVIPDGCLLNPPPDAAVAVGNVETSQRIVDVLLGALGVAAASQGTMNNLLFGRPDGSGSQYYETIPGGYGAVEGHDGASGLQVHMTNTRVTDPEILEHRFPGVKVTRFALRKGSGGSGKWQGGEGVERALRFSEPMHLTVISERRKTAPFGLQGGRSGAPGENILIDAYGTHQALEGRIDRIVNPGETILVRTPGGGGFGKPDIT